MKMKKTELNSEMLEKVNGGADMDFLKDGNFFDKILNPDNDPGITLPKPVNGEPDIDTIREIMKKVVNDYGTGYEF